jgi:hypothetical protein
MECLEYIFHLCTIDISKHVSLNFFSKFARISIINVVDDSLHINLLSSKALLFGNLLYSFKHYIGRRSPLRRDNYFNFKQTIVIAGLDVLSVSAGG